MSIRNIILSILSAFTSDTEYTKQVVLNELGGGNVLGLLASLQLKVQILRMDYSNYNKMGYEYSYAKSFLAHGCIPLLGIGHIEYFWVFSKQDRHDQSCNNPGAPETCTNGRYLTDDIMQEYMLLLYNSFSNYRTYSYAVEAYEAVMADVRA